MKNNLSHVSKVIAQHCFVTPAHLRGVTPSFCFTDLGGNPLIEDHLMILITWWLPTVNDTIARCPHIFEKGNFNKKFFFDTIVNIIHTFLEQTGELIQSNDELKRDLLTQLDFVQQALFGGVVYSCPLSFHSTNYQPGLWPATPPQASPLPFMPVRSDSSY